MYPQRRQQRRARSPEGIKMQRELHKLKRRRSDRKVVLLIALGALGLYIAVELGRTMFYMQSVKAFAGTIEQLSPAEVKTEVQQFAHGLYSANPLINRGSIAALKIATGWNCGTDVNAWRQRWAAEEPYWHYRSHNATNAPAPPAVDWRKELPSREAPKP